MLECGTDRLGRAAALQSRNGNRPCHQWEGHSLHPPRSGALQGERPALEHSDWAGTAQSCHCSPIPCDPWVVGEVAISCSSVIEEIIGSRHPFFPYLVLQKATPDLPVQLLPNLVLSRRYGLRGEKIYPTIKGAYANPVPADRKGFGSDTYDRRPSRSLQSDSPQMG